MQVDHKVGYKAPEEEAAEEEAAVGLGGMKGGKEEREKRKQIDIGETHSQAVRLSPSCCCSALMNRSVAHEMNMRCSSGIRQRW